MQQLHEKLPKSSPRPWGCFSYPTGKTAVEVVFPTPVGVFPSGDDGCRIYFGLPHARGGVSALVSLAL